MGFLFFKGAGVNVVSGLLLLVGLVSIEAFAQTLKITAKYSPDPNNPSKNSFVNTTPVSGYCGALPKECAANKMFSIAFNNTTNVTSISANHADPRQGAMIKVPSEWKEVSVEGSNGDIHLLKLRISGFGNTYRVDNGSDHSTLWVGGTWMYAPLPCRYSGIALGNDREYTYFWKTPNNGVCAKKALRDISSFKFDNFNFAYEMITPDPLAMSSGSYTGRAVYTLGPGQDFDFGDRLFPDDPILELDFELSITHVLKMQFPPGAERLSLIPDGGWQQWLHRGRRPEKLFANQSFQFWSSARFKMQLECDYIVGEHCGIRNESGHEVPVETRVTLPAGITGLSPQAVNRQLLSATHATHFTPSQYVDNGRASLHFEVGRDSVKDMTEHAGSRYSGNVIVVFDSQVDG